jgi:glycosyltransferase involved in cell wall biosynthesis
VGHEPLREPVGGAGVIVVSSRLGSLAVVGGFRLVIGGLDLGPRLARWWLRLSGLTRRRAWVSTGDPVVSFLIFNAYGMGGTVRTTLNLAGELARDRRVELISLVRHRQEPFFDFPDDVEVRALEDRTGAPRSAPARLLAHVPSLLLCHGDRASRKASLYTDVVLVRALARLPDGVLVATRPNLNLAALQARRPGLAIVGAEHMNFARHPKSLQEEIRRRYPQLDALVVLTERDREAYSREVAGLQRVRRIPNAVSPAATAPPPLDEPVVIAAGRLSSQKGFDRLIRAFAWIAEDCPGWTLRICGNGPERLALERQVVELGLQGRVTLAGPVERLDREFEGASIFVLSSRFEGLPMVLLEAMSKGLPVVAFDCPTGPREVIRHPDDGILIGNGDEPALGRAILALINDPARRRRLGAAAMERSGDYSLAVVAPRWRELLDELGYWWRAS